MRRALDHNLTTVEWGIRILLSVVLAFAAFLCLLVIRVFTAVYLGFSAQDSMYLAGAVTFVFAATLWLLIWRDMVNWNPIRIAATGLAVIVAWVLGFPAGTYLAGGDQDFGWFLSAVLPSLLFTFLCIPLWLRLPARSKVEAAAEIPCPKCGYNLRGLSEARCPECGSRFTLEELVGRIEKI